MKAIACIIRLSNLPTLCDLKSLKLWTVIKKKKIAAVFEILGKMSPSSSSTGQIVKNKHLEHDLNIYNM